MRAPLSVVLTLALAGSTVTAEPLDAGTGEEGALVRAAAADPLAGRLQRNAELAAELAGLDQAVAQVDALGAEVTVLPEALAGRVGSAADTPEAAAALGTQLADAAAGFREQHADALAVEDALAAATPVDGDAGVGVEGARLARASLERRILSQRIALAGAMTRWLERSAAAREASGSDAFAQELARDRQEAEHAERAAALARQQALEREKGARSQADAVIGRERAAIEAVRGGQAAHRRWVLEQKRQIAVASENFETLRRRLETGELSGDRAFERIRALLAQVRTTALSDLGALLTGIRTAPRPAALDPALSKLPEAYDREIAELAAAGAALAAQATILEEQARVVLRDRATLLHHQAQVLNAQRVSLLARLPAARRDRLLGFTEPALSELRGEAAQAALEIGYWAERRQHQLRALRVGARDRLADIGTWAWRVLEILLIFLLVRFARRRWDRWVVGLIEAVGQSMPISDWALHIARALEVVRIVGPGLLTLGAGYLVYHLLGAGAAAVEVRIGWLVFFWVLVVRIQLRLVQSFARWAGIRARDRARDRQELEGPEAATTRQSVVETIAPGGLGQPLEPAPAWALLSRSWRVLSGFAAVLLIVLALIAHAVGRGVTYHLTTAIAWWAALPLAIYLLHLWRPRVVHEFRRRADDRGGMSRLVERHSHRFYGVFIIAIASVVLLVRRVARFGRGNLANLDATKRLLAFLFRRRVERHAQQHGRVLARPPTLPEAIVEQFPMGPMEPAQGPVESLLLPEVLTAFRTWQHEKVDGSVAIVGGSGMGKTTLLNLIHDAAGEAVLRGSFLTKITTPEELYLQLARLLELDGTPASEAELVNLIEMQPAALVVLDDCHHLFLRRVRGFEAWEAFTRIINETSDHVFWVLSFNGPAWEYLSNIASGVAYFRRVLRIQPWSDEDIRRLILARMRRAGYQVSFHDLLVTRLESVQMSAQIIRTSQGYFRLLWDFTDGNPRLASHFWLRSIMPDPEARSVRVHLFAAPQIDELEQLPDDIAFILTAVAEHERVTAEELATIVNMPLELCRFALRYGREHGYLSRDRSTGRSRLSSQWQQPIIRYLKRKHFLYS